MQASPSWGPRRRAGKRGWADTWSGGSCSRPETFAPLGLEELGVSIRRFNETLQVPCGVPVLMYTGRWASTWNAAYQKLQAFSLEEFSKVLLLDLDVKIQGNLDHIFEIPLPSGGVAGQRNDDICLGEDFDQYLDLPIVGQNRSRSEPEGRDLLRHTGYAKLVEKLFKMYSDRVTANTSAGLDLMDVGGSKIGRQKLSRSPRDTWNLGLNSGILLLVPNRTDLEGLQRIEGLLPHDCSEWWPDGADQVVIANYFVKSSRAWILPATDAAYAHCSFFYETSGYVPSGQTIRAVHATAEKYFPELMGVTNLLSALGVPRAAHGLLWAYRRATMRWGRATRSRRKAQRDSAKLLRNGTGGVA
mmetsp:Transcript_75502/g.233571  ORF Transcript_75502/g.233571 Transcript_75502/m.233571 type:complete len:359 (+) Transcript_75502:184-1260(+)